jgi:hypothetical protein
VTEEHGDFSVEKYHSNTFKKFLKTIGISEEYMQELISSAPVTIV